jgi:hypothetical protein
MKKKSFSRNLKLAVGASLVFLGVAMGLRYQYDSNLLVSIPLLLVVVGAYLAYLHSDRADVRAIDKRIERSERKIVKATGLIEINKKKLDDRKDMLKVEAKSLAKNLMDNLNQELIDLNQVEKETKGKKNEFLMKLGVVHKIGQKNYSEGYRDGSNSSSGNHSNGKDKSTNKFSSVIIGLVMTSILGACSPAPPPETFTMVALIDKSEEGNTVDVDGIMKLYRGMSGIVPGKVKMVESTFIGATIKDIYLSDTISNTYKRPGSFLGRKEWAEQDRIENHFKSVFNSMEEYCQPGPGLQHSYIPQAICQQVSLLQETKSDKKVLLIYSDLLVHTQGFSVYHWKHNPERLLKQDKKFMLDYLLEQCSSDLTGIDALIVHRPHPCV